MNIMAFKNVTYRKVGANPKNISPIFTCDEDVSIGRESLVILKEKLSLPLCVYTHRPLCNTKNWQEW